MSDKVIATYYSVDSVDDNFELTISQQRVSKLGSEHVGENYFEAVVMLFTNYVQLRQFTLVLESNGVRLSGL